MAEAAEARSLRPPLAPAELGVWAPLARTGVDLVVAPATPQERRVRLRPGERGWWWHDQALAPGTRYGFSIDSGPLTPDPRSRRQPDGPHEPSEAFDPGAFAWNDGDWTGLELADCVLYELHLGTFTPAGTFDAAIERLSHLVDLGVEAVSLMPVAAFPGRHGWGYDGVCPWAVHEPYGGPPGLQRFVDACHVRGLAVVLDVVYNHLGPDGNYLGRYGPYFTDRYVTPWGAAVNLDGPGSDEVRAYLLDNTLSWLADFHLDGVRLDAVHEMHDNRAITLLEELAESVDRLAEAIGRRLWVIAESDRNDPATVRRRDEGGQGLTAQWADDVHHGLHVALTGDTQGYYRDFAADNALATVLTRPFFHADSYSSFRGRTHGRGFNPADIPGWRFVASLQTHDQVGNRCAGDRLSASLSPRRLRCAAALLLTGPYTPMLFMGEEWAAGTPWQFFTDFPADGSGLADAVRQGRVAEFAAHGWPAEQVPDPQDLATLVRSRLNWSELEREPHSSVLGWYRALLALRSARVDLRDHDLAATRVGHDETTGAVLVHRGQHRVAVNLGGEPVRVPLDLPEDPRCVVLLSLDPTLAVEDGAVTLPAEGAVVIGPTRATRPPGRH
ncbi:MAG TPA: malto-oligosyltrehalose trehalohydrolase [Dermatophilaceae bacterium]|nr:malto-oligosyltrehalose trehalohydrolase [Dermatophilaceae bacterium]